MDALVQDLKAAARSLRARKGFVALAVGTLALALGANSSVFGIIHAVLLEQLPYRDPERLAILWNVKADGENEVLSIANFEDYQGGARALERIAGWFEQGVNLTGEGEPERLFASKVSAGSSRSSVPLWPWAAPSAPPTTKVAERTWPSSATPSGGAASVGIRR